MRKENYEVVKRRLKTFARRTKLYVNKWLQRFFGLYTRDENVKQIESVPLVLLESKKRILYYSEC